jgi:hypothetical protein
MKLGFVVVVELEVNTSHIFAVTRESFIKKEKITKEHNIPTTNIIPLFIIRDFHLLYI